MIYIPYPRVNCLKTKPFTAAHTYIAHIWQYPPPPPPPPATGKICLAKRIYSYADELPKNTRSSLLKKAKRPIPVDVPSNRLI